MNLLSVLLTYLDHPVHSELAAEPSTGSHYASLCSRQVLTNYVLTFSRAYARTSTA